MFKVLAIIGALLAVLEAVKENNKKKNQNFFKCGILVPL
jgi:hypothetical protein